MAISFRKQEAATLWAMSHSDTAMTAAVAGGGLLALGGIWLIVEWCLRYSVNHGVGIVLWHGKWPTDRAERKALDDRLDRAQDRELRALKRLRPIPISLVVLGLVLIAVASV